ncbi:MAG: hypothetical protein K0R99_156 [Microbacterium sp.]|jgi:hypothetical protein|uniref:hypothetical protein n=1 Tax=Microbacterium sp. TaxID=51671 RepID=UPI0026163F6D|nr:hypothetical protein [Microbacterium sp.]MDF2558710.1 hypothetical protein [Microbacterium sp.]
MTAFGIPVALAGVILFHTALWMALRANAEASVPIWRNAVTVPPRSTALRAVGAGLLVLGAVTLASSGWWWPLLVVVAGPGLALGAIAVHNRGVEQATRGSEA